jgi:MFS family permease
MKAGIAALVAGYVLSQFYRAFLAVLSTALTAEIGATPAQLGRASGMFLLAFALAQLPIGPALDRIGPRRITAFLLGLCGGGGALVIASANSALAVQVGMALLGAGCAPVLMASYYIYARSFPPRLFATLGSVTMAAGSLGNLGGTVPLAWAADAVGWRVTLVGMAVLTVGVAAAVLALVRDPPVDSATGSRGSYLDILRLREVWPILPLMSLNYIAIGLSGLWIGPFLADRYGLDQVAIGWAALVIGAAMISGTLAYGPLDRLFHTRKWVIVGGNLMCASAMLVLAGWPSAPLTAAVALLAATLFFGATFPLCMAHARSFAPPGKAGRAMAMFNFFSIGGAGLMQVASARVHTIWPDWSVLFLFFALPLLVAIAIFLRARDSLT